MRYRIKHISFLLKGDRRICKVGFSGMFRLRASWNSNIRKANSKILTAKDFIKHPVVQSGDPVLTLSNGDKLRVYLGGVAPHMMTEAISIIELHDLEANTHKKNNKQDKKKDPPKTIFSTPLDHLFEDFPEW